MLAKLTMRILILTIFLIHSLTSAEDKADLFKKLYANAYENFNITVKLCDRARIYKLNGETQDASNNITGFPIKPYGNVISKITSEIYIDQDKLNNLKAVLLLMTKESQEGPAFCHHPGFGIRLYLENRLLIETSICFECNNWYIPFLESSTWVGLPGKEDNAHILKTLSALFPNE